MEHRLRHPSLELRCDAIDLPAIVPATRQAVIEAGRGRQFDFVPGDLFEVDLSATDTTWRSLGTSATSSTRRQPATAEHSVRALTPGGTLAIADIVPDQGSGSRSAGLYELGLHHADWQRRCSLAQGVSRVARRCEIPAARNPGAGR
jgi:hypothetical protein